jgi:ABC-type maltose transport system permease subunit
MQIFSIVILACGYYTMTYGLSQWKEGRKLGAFGTFLAAALGTVIPIAVLFIKA